MRRSQEEDQGRQRDGRATRGLVWHLTPLSDGDGMNGWYACMHACSCKETHLTHKAGWERNLAPHCSSGSCLDARAHDLCAFPVFRHTVEWSWCFFCLIGLGNTGFSPILELSSTFHQQKSENKSQPTSTPACSIRGADGFFILKINSFVDSVTVYSPLCCSRALIITL